MSELYSILKSELTSRSKVEELAGFGVLADLYEGKLPESYKRFFPKNEPTHVVNMVRLAHDDLATQVGRMPDLVKDPENRTAAEGERVGKLERIAMQYVKNSLPGGKQFMWELAWWLLGGRAVAIITDDGVSGPRFELRDPRSCYPGVKRRAGTRPVELEDLMFKYEIPRSEAVRMGLAPERQPDKRKIAPTPHDTAGADMVEVIEYLDTEKHVLCTAHAAITEFHNMGFVPGHVFQSFAPNSLSGLSQFQDQISLMVAISRLITQKLAFGDRIVYPVYWVKGHEGTVKLGPMQLNKLSLQGDIGSLQPEMTLQADRDIEMLERFSRILNRNPEMRQGEIQNSAQYTASKTLEQLSESIDTVIGRYWDIISDGMEDLLAKAFEWDEVWYSGVERQINGTMRGRRYNDTYEPAKDIAGDFELKVHYGFGLGGYQGFLMNLQANAAGVQSKRRAIEEMPGVSDVEELLREIELERMDEAGAIAFQTMASQPGGLDLRIWSRIRQQMAKKGLPLHEAIIKYEEMLAEQAAAAQAAEQQAMAMTVPDMAQEEAMPEEQLEGIPAEVFA